jgi:hypothetical protein
MSAKFYPAVAAQGGLVGCLDAIDGAELADGDRGILLAVGGLACYRLVDDPEQEGIPPVTNPGDKRWIEIPGYFGPDTAVDGGTW